MNNYKVLPLVFSSMYSFLAKLTFIVLFGGLISLKPLQACAVNCEENIENFSMMVPKNDPDPSPDWWSNLMETVLERAANGSLGDHTAYSVDLDVCHDALDNEGTGNFITVEFLDETGRTIATVNKKGVPENCYLPDMTFKAEIRRMPTKFRIRTNGDDGLFIDEIRCYQSQPFASAIVDGLKSPSRKLVGRHGHENGKGWCFSTDPQDAYGGWNRKCENGCQKEQTFSFYTNVKNHEEKDRASFYTVKIDNCHSDLENEGTGNSITVEFLNGKEVVSKTVRKGVSSNCYSPDETFKAITPRPVTAVRVSTNGDDGYYIDEIRLYKNDEEVNRHGDEDGGGWCLSTDPGDAHRSWKGKCNGTGNSCWKSVTFPY